jgi:uncharacterized protein YndB with AHSA1/START domain
MPNSIVTADQDALVTEIEVAAPPSRVFEALTDAKQMFRWWGSKGPCKSKVWEFDARVGGKWRMQAYDTTDQLSINGVKDFQASGEVVEFDPPRVLAYTWEANWHDDASKSTLVRWELFPTKNGTRVTVTHSGLRNQPKARADYSGGWPGVVHELKSYVET